MTFRVSLGKTRLWALLSPLSGHCLPLLGTGSLGQLGGSLVGAGPAESPALEMDSLGLAGGVGIGSF